MFSVKNPQLLPALTLAYIGDAVFELYIRTSLVEQGKMNVQSLHIETVKRVNASTQAKLFDLIIPELNEQELAIAKRGRNTKTKHHPKNAEIIDYRKSTGLETLVGFWYLTDNKEKIIKYIKKINQLI